LKRSKLTQAHLAKKPETDQTRISSFKNGHVRPSAEEEAAIAYFVHGSVIEALSRGGHLDEPPWVKRLESRLGHIEGGLAKSK
jgi:hypothetical protein